MKTDNSPARGMRDLLPADTTVRDHVLASVTAVYKRYGYQRIETPALEDISRLTSGEGADNEKLVFEVLRRGLPAEIPPGTRLRDLVDLGLRYDLTVPLTRFYGAHQAKLPTPFRSLQVGPVWRGERPARGRYRQFYQCDIDMIGEPTMLAEAELIEATTEALAAVGLDNVTVRISDRRFLSALATASGVPAEAQDGFFITLDKLDKIGWDRVRGELAENGLSAETIDRVVDTITGLQDLPADKLANALANAIPGAPDELVADLSSTAAALDQLSAQRPVSWEFDPTLVRGMGYYTGHIFEITRSDVPFSLAGGGRYDKLIGRWLGKDVPAVGFSIGFERIVDLLEAGVDRDAVAVLAEADVAPADALAVARDLRGDSAGAGSSGDGGSRVVEVVRRSGKFGAQLKRLESAGFAAFVAVQVRDGEVVRGELRSLGGGPEA
ncbi:MAG TPA: histidine--tRNA ligase [Trebonia sp.]